MPIFDNRSRHISELAERVQREGVHTARYADTNALSSSWIYREELWLAVKEENRAAATADALPLARAPTPHGHVPDAERPTTAGHDASPSKNRSHPGGDRRGQS